MKTKRQSTTLPAFTQGVRRMVKRLGERVGQADAEDLRFILTVQSDLEETLVRAVAGLRDAGYTWEHIGEALGITRQGALMRFRVPVAEYNRQHAGPCTNSVCRLEYAHNDPCDTHLSMPDPVGTTRLDIITETLNA